jgi:hypothetical protein
MIEPPSPARESFCYRDELSLDVAAEYVVKVFRRSSIADGIESCRPRVPRPAAIFIRLSMPGAAFFRSSRFMAGWNSISASNARNHGSATAGIGEVSFRSKTMNPVLFPLSAAK